MASLLYRHLYDHESEKLTPSLWHSSKMSTFGIHRLDWLVVSERFPWNAKYETVYRWLTSFIVIYTIMTSLTASKLSCGEKVVK
jgi:hypothetical protein